MLLYKLRFLLHFCFALITFLSKRPHFHYSISRFPRVRSVRPESCPSEATTSTLLSFFLLYCRFSEAALEQLPILTPTVELADTCGTPTLLKAAQSADLRVA